MTTTTPRTALLGEPEPPPQPPVRPRRRPGRVLAAALCALLGTGLTVTAATGAWSQYRAAHRPLPPDAAYRQAGSLWRSTPVDTLFPPVLTGPAAGPGGADRSWTRVALAPDSDCPAALSAEWRAALAATGCTRVLRAAYTDATRSSLITVGMVFTPGDAAAMATAGARLGVPPAYGFADGHRAAWTASVLPDAPVVVYTVSAFADGRTVDAPRPAAEATAKDATGAVAQAGLGHEARAVADRFAAALRALARPVAAPDAQATG
ncbi:hypothetical protein [Streptomyces subrutilus]|uniref:Uncharacterized protein n=1 Tax=Streptomyces subrutilus TaxID=36818 RepID=A0A918R4X5_9ACTN|nr:hypothetical protein [Streptomyces subrutilus]WSJ29297.1 hypothetical protein OG479_08195 [Streptomyces subrutilus]GGZ87425.1 hypothetical protein GCM10010371_54100 [Streptomyces subrutilus]